MPLGAKLHIETLLQNEKTILKTSFCTQPFKIANVTENKRAKELRLMLMSSSPGVLDGDRYEMQIDVGAECSLALETQSYQRIFQMQSGATQLMTVSMMRGSSFAYLPHPVVPHQHACFRARNKLFLNEDCSLIWGEVISCGRKLNGEIFRFSLYHAITEIYKKNKLVVKENLLLKPTEMNLVSIGQLEGFTHQATLLFLNEDVDTNELTKELLLALAEADGISFGVSALPVNGLIVRLLGHRAEQLFTLVKTCSLLLQKTQRAAFKNNEVHVC
jgi:urease accessory protein